MATIKKEVHDFIRRQNVKDLVTIRKALKRMKRGTASYLALMELKYEMQRSLAELRRQR